MFAALFGYGMVQIARRQERNGILWHDASARYCAAGAGG